MRDGGVASVKPLGNIRVPLKIRELVIVCRSVSLTIAGRGKKRILAGHCKLGATQLKLLWADLRPEQSLGTHLFLHTSQHTPLKYTKHAWTFL